jgi:hypothetical protein
MNAKAALCFHLLSGKTVNIKNCFELIGYTNAPRELSRMIEAPFEVRLERKRRDGKSRYGQPVCWFDYTLPHTEENKEGIKKMRDYVAENWENRVPKPKFMQTEIF